MKGSVQYDYLMERIGMDDFMALHVMAGFLNKELNRKAKNV